MSNVIPLSESYRIGKVFRKAPKEGGTLATFQQMEPPLKRRVEFETVALSLLKVEDECTHFMRIRRLGDADSGMMVRRVVEIFVEDLEDLAKFLVQINDDTAARFYLKVAKDTTLELQRALGKVKAMSKPGAPEVERTIDKIEKHLGMLRRSLAHVFEAETTPLPEAAYNL